MLSCTFAGHRNLFLPDADRKIETALDGLIARDETFVFYTGGMGEFDSKCASAVRAAKHRHHDKEIRLILVLPYMSNRLNTDRNYYESSFDDVMIPIELADIHPKAAIHKSLDGGSERRAACLCSPRLWRRIRNRPICHAKRRTRA